MMLCFLDSSSVTKLFVEEPGSTQIRHYLAHFNPMYLVVSRLATLEVSSALQRYTTSGRISLSERDRQLEELSVWLEATSQVDIDEDPLTTATRMVLGHQHLRSLDAIQLASAVLAREAMKPGERILFIASDHRLLKVAKLEGFEVWDPADPDLRPIPAIPVN